MDLDPVAIRIGDPDLIGIVAADLFRRMGYPDFREMRHELLHVLGFQAEMGDTVVHYLSFSAVEELDVVVR